MTSKHYSVMKKEALHFLNVQKNGIYVDGTLGRAGHSKEILREIGNGHLYAFDLDMTALEESKLLLNEFTNFTLIHDNFANMGNHLPKKVNGILLDLGVSSPQFDVVERGFSYRGDAPLDMRMNREQSISAKEVVNQYSLENLIRIFRKYGEEKFSVGIAKKIVDTRAKKTIETTSELVEIIKSALPAKVLKEKGHPAKRIFQALRIEVNQELASLEKFLDEFPQYLAVGGVVVILSFHSLEDRLVKHKFQELTTVKVDKYIPVRPEDIEMPPFEDLVRGGQKASEKEILENNRSHSVRLRAIRKVR